MNSLRQLGIALACIIILTLTACGGGGGSSSSSSTPGSSSVSGVAATGAPLSGALILLTDKNGKTANTTANEDGTYSIDVTGLTAPFVIVATGAVGDAQTTQASIVSDAPAAGSSSTANINPLTNAIATLLSSGSDPAALSSNLGSVTATSISNATALLNTALGGLASASGAKSNFNPMTDTATANGTGFDRLLDNLTFGVQPGTGAILFAKDGATIDDMAPTSTAPSPSTPNSSNALLIASNTSSLSALPSSLVVRDFTVANYLQDALNKCFAIPYASGRASNALCTTGIAAPDYLNNAKTLVQDLSGWMNTTYDGATFKKPEIIRFFTPTRALVKISGLRADGVYFSLLTVISKVTVSGNTSSESPNGTWQLTGNQRSFNVGITGMAMRQIEVNSSYSIPSAYFSAISPFIDLTVNNLSSTIFASSGGNASNPGTSCTGSACSYVNVTGPGLPVAGLFYKRNTSNSSCNTQLVLAVDITTNMSGAGCTSVYKLNGVAIDPNKSLDVAFDPSIRANSQGGSIAAIANYTASGRASVDAVIGAITPFTPYVFKIYDGTTGNTTYVVERLKGRPPTTAELAKYQWLELDQATLDQMYSTAANPFPGGATINIGWKRSAFALPAKSAYIQFQSSTQSLVSLNKNLPVSATIGSVTASITNTSGVFPSAPTASTVPSGTYRGRSWIGVQGRDPSDTVIYSAYSYSN
ncbi:hypothetical protein ICN18_04230 [Polynucleobacter sp. Ross1-W9]|uniref:hypothetical protein n=1 Tax=Polynucleobacter parvulilacunae TaxID=1855631 RepID=UPI001C0B40CE|nr:hypothetical protein [Polynucleobacter parvulilacunae]MBU3556831.1 hypothetical protein [Polynucleobacter parvulilacunae]